jgi:hypothetical protein
MKEVRNYHVQAWLTVRSIESAVSHPNTLFRVKRAWLRYSDGIVGALDVRIASLG